jgi:hypothetical protein
MYEMENDARYKKTLIRKYRRVRTYELTNMPLSSRGVEGSAMISSNFVGAIEFFRLQRKKITENNIMCHMKNPCSSSLNIAHPEINAKSASAGSAIEADLWYVEKLKIKRSRK